MTAARYIEALEIKRISWKFVSLNNLLNKELVSQFYFVPFLPISRYAVIFIKKEKLSSADSFLFIVSQAYKY